MGCIKAFALTHLSLGLICEISKMWLTESVCCCLAFRACEPHRASVAEVPPLTAKAVVFDGFT